MNRPPIQHRRPQPPPQARDLPFPQPPSLHPAPDPPRASPLPANIHPNTVRANCWRMVDYAGDGVVALVVGVEDWTDSGWDAAYDANARWMNGPLRGYVYLLRITGTN